MGTRNEPGQVGGGDLGGGRDVGGEASHFRETRKRPVWLKLRAKGRVTGTGRRGEGAGWPTFLWLCTAAAPPAPGGSGRPRLPVTPAGLQPSRAPLPAHRGALAVWPLSSTATQRRDQPCPPSETRAAGLCHSGDLACCPWDWGCKETESPLPTPAPRPSSFPRHSSW